MRCNFKKSAELKKINDIEASAAETVCWLSLIALNNCEGFGKKRLEKYANELSNVSDEFSTQRKKYGDEIAYTRLAKRVSQIMKDDYFYKGDLK